MLQYCWYKYKYKHTHKQFLQCIEGYGVPQSLYFSKQTFGKYFTGITDWALLNVCGQKQAADNGAAP